MLRAYFDFSRLKTLLHRDLTRSGSGRIRFFAVFVQGSFHFDEIENGGRLASPAA